MSGLLSETVIDGKSRDKAWRAGLDAAYDGRPNAINPHPVDSELAKYWADGWLDGERLLWVRQLRSHQIRSHTLH